MLQRFLLRKFEKTVGEKHQGFLSALAVGTATVHNSRLLAVTA
jgi:hypothetical protein